MIAARTTLADWIHLIRSEYLEIPGLHSTQSQVQRLWGLDAVTCEALLAALVDVSFLILRIEVRAGRTAITSPSPTRFPSETGTSFSARQN